MDISCRYCGDHMYRFNVSCHKEYNFCQTKGCPNYRDEVKMSVGMVGKRIDYVSGSWIGTKHKVKTYIKCDQCSTIHTVYDDEETPEYWLCEECEDKEWMLIN